MLPENYRNSFHITLFKFLKEIIKTNRHWRGEKKQNHSKRLELMIKFNIILCYLNIFYVLIA